MALTITEVVIYIAVEASHLPLKQGSNYLNNRNIAGINADLARVKAGQLE